jgi:hypothetical protein
MIVGYADGIALVVVGKNLANVVGNRNQAISRIISFLKKAVLELAVHKKLY